MNRFVLANCLRVEKVLSRLKKTYPRPDELFLVLFSYPITQIGFSTHPKYVERSVARILFLSAFITIEYSSELRDDKIL